MNLLCIEFSDRQWIDIITRVASQSSGQPVYWTGAASRKADVLSAFPNAVFHENLMAVRGVPAPEWKPGSLLFPDGDTLDALLPIQSIALKMMDRMDPSGDHFNYEERIRHYYRLVAYWDAVLTELRVNAVLMPIAPHMIYDFVLYGLCKLRGIPTLLFDRTAIPVRVLALDSYDGAAPALRARYIQRMTNDGLTELCESTEQYLLRLQGDFAAGMAPNFKLKMTRLGLATKGGIEKPTLGQILKHELKGIYQNLARQRLRVPRTYVKVKSHPPEKKAVGHLGYYLNRWRGIAKKAQMRRLYERLQVNPDYKAKFIFVALHYQPERNTVPIGKHYADQFLLLAQLSRGLPSGWRIYVKEHTWQLQPYSRGQHGRRTNFYSDVASLPNVQFVPMSISSFELIDASVAVASVSGSVGWEGINRGKPAIIFGDAWYQDCEGVYRADSEPKLTAALGEIEQGVTIHRENIRKFVAALEDVALNAVLEFNLEASGGISREQNVESLAMSYIERLKKIELGST